MHAVRKRPHLGEKRSKINVRIKVNHIRFFINDFFLKNSYYCLYFEGKKGGKVKTHTLIKSIEALTAEEGLKVDGTIDCSMTMFQDDLHKKYMNGRLKAKYKRMIVRQMTKLRSGEVLYRDVGYVSLPLHRLIEAPEQFDTRLILTHPANVIDAFVDVSIEAKVDGFMSMMPTSLDTPRSVVRSVQSGLNLVGLGSPIVKARFISLDSQYFGDSPDKPTYVDLNNLQPKMSAFSLDSNPNMDTIPLSDSNSSFFFRFLNSPGRKASVASSAAASNNIIKVYSDSGVLLTSDSKYEALSPASTNNNRKKKGVTFTSQLVVFQLPPEEEEDNEEGELSTECSSSSSSSDKVEIVNDVKDSGADCAVVSEEVTPELMSTTDSVEDRSNGSTNQDEVEASELDDANGDHVGE